ncbi:aspartate/glutamate racemase family protein [Burkholderia sp. SR8]|uniref:aspartate/glutamate racemase family protein n=1 Tax=Burkholderia sp. SR8 TaxID=3062277 RepID=UPI0040634C19
MPSVTRIGLVHATPLAVTPIAESFATHWPDAQIHNLLDDALTADLAAAGGRIEAMAPRLMSLARYAVDAGAAAVLFTCSAFGPAIDAIRPDLAVPVLKPNEAMIDDALGHGRRICLVATFEPALAPISTEFHARASELGREIELESCAVPLAMDALRHGDTARHDQLIAQTCAEHADADVFCFAQFSMTSARRDTASRVGAPVLTTPDSAVRLLKSQLSR